MSNPYTQAARNMAKVHQAVERGARAAEKEGARTFATTASLLAPVDTGALKLALGDSAQSNGTVVIPNAPGDQDPRTYAPIVAERDPFLNLAAAHTIAVLPTIATRNIRSEVAVEVGKMKRTR